MEEKLTIIDGEYDDWVPLRRIDKDVAIDEKVQVINCDTRDFAIAWSFEQPEEYKKAYFNYEVWTNKGLSMIGNLEKEGKLEDYLIEPTEIVSWLDEVCQKTGGYDKNWRFFTAKLDGCRDWKIKYIRFVRRGDRFIVCNSYMRPVKWRLIIENIYDPVHDADDAIDKRDIERQSWKAEWDPVYTLQNTYLWQGYENKPKKACYEGPCCGRCRNRFKKSEFCSKHNADTNCYRFKLEKQ